MNTKFVDIGSWLNRHTVGMVTIINPFVLVRVGQDSNRSVSPCWLEWIPNIYSTNKFDIIEAEIRRQPQLLPEQTVDNWMALPVIELSPFLRTYKAFCQRVPGDRVGFAERMGGMFWTMIPLMP